MAGTSWRWRLVRQLGVGRPGAWLAHTARWLSTARTACASWEALGFGFQMSVTSSVIGVSEVVVRFGM